METQMLAGVSQVVPVPAVDPQWRNLALQFDAHRMAALGHLKLLLQHGDAHADAVRQFLSAPPLDGEAVLAERIREMAPQATPSGFFSYSAECGFDRHDTAEAAKEAAQETLDSIRQELGGEEWPMDIESICWGTIVERAAEHNLQAVSAAARARLEIMDLTKIDVSKLGATPLDPAAEMHVENCTRWPWCGCPHQLECVHPTRKLRCPACGEPQFDCPGGVTCPNGHGGLEGV